MIRFLIIFAMSSLLIGLYAMGQSVRDVVADNRQVQVSLKKSPTGHVRGWYFIQLGTFRSKGNASRLYQDLLDQDFFVEMREEKHSSLGEVFVVKTKIMDYYKAKSYLPILTEVTGLKPALIRAQ